MGVLISWYVVATICLCQMIKGHKKDDSSCRNPIYIEPEEIE